MLQFKEQRSAGAGLDFVLSDESVDRMNDVILSAGWQLSNFKRNPIALFGHSSGFPIGTWKNLHVDASKKALVGTFERAPKGTGQRVDEINNLVEAGVLVATSVGFRELESVPRHDEEGHMVGLTFTRQELIEVSIVAVPANANALSTAKALNISSATRDLVFVPPSPEQALLAWHRTLARKSPVSSSTSRPQRDELAELARELGLGELEPEPPVVAEQHRAETDPLWRRAFAIAAGVKR